MFDWNQSPLSVQAAQERAAKDAEARRGAAQERKVNVTRYERRVHHLSQWRDAGLSTEVNLACDTWLKKRGVHLDSKQYFRWQSLKAVGERSANKRELQSA